MKYQDIREVTPAGSCIIIQCPGVYSAVRVEASSCILAGCPSVSSGKLEGAQGMKFYLVVGKPVSREAVKGTPLEGRVADDEAVVEVPRSLLDNFGSEVSLGHPSIQGKIREALSG